MREHNKYHGENGMEHMLKCRVYEEYNLIKDKFESSLEELNSKLLDKFISY